MPRIRRHAAILVLAWMVLGPLASAVPGHLVERAGVATQAGGTSHCGERARDPLPKPPASPCQWPLPLLCCQDRAAADVASPGLVMLGAVGLQRLVPSVVLAPSALGGTRASFWTPASRCLERSVVLQV